MGRPRILLVSFLLVSGVATQAAQISITVDPSAAGRTAILRFKRIDGPAKVQERSVRLPGSVDVPLDEGVWEVRFAGDRLWAAPVFVKHDDVAAIKVWAAVALTGTTNEVTALRVEFRPLDANSATGEVDCEVNGKAWSCAVPAGSYDLRFSSPGFAPEHRFGIDAGHDPLPLSLHFVPGASLTGRVEAARGVKIPPGASM